MAAALPIMQIAGGAVGAEGALVKGRMTADTLNFQAGLQRTQAEQAIQQGDFNSFLSGLRATTALGRSSAAYGAAGVTSDSGSVASVLGAGAANAELDRQNILHGAQIKAANYKNQAILDEYGANSALTGSYFSALSSLLGSSSGVASAFMTPGAGGSGATPGTDNSMKFGAPQTLPASLEDPGLAQGIA